MCFRHGKDQACGVMVRTFEERERTVRPSGELEPCQPAVVQVSDMCACDFHVGRVLAHERRPDYLNLQAQVESELCATLRYSILHTPGAGLRESPVNPPV